jgi:hypothetical protein
VVTPFVVNRLEIDFARPSFAGELALEVEGIPGPSRRFALSLRADRNEPGCRLWIPVVAQPGVRKMVRVDRVRVRFAAGSAPRMDEILAVRLLRTLPSFAAEAEIRAVSGASDAMQLTVAMQDRPAISIETFRIRIYHVRDALTEFEVRAADTVMSSDGRRIHRIPFSRRALRATGVTPGLDLYLRVDAFAGSPDPLHLRARSRPSVVRWR